MLAHKASTHECQRNEIIPSVFSDHRGIKLEIHDWKREKPPGIRNQLEQTQQARHLSGNLKKWGGNARGSLTPC